MKDFSGEVEGGVVEVAEDMTLIITKRIIIEVMITTAITNLMK